MDEGERIRLLPRGVRGAPRLRHAPRRLVPGVRARARARAKARVRVWARVGLGVRLRVRVGVRVGVSVRVRSQCDPGMQTPRGPK